MRVGPPCPGARFNDFKEPPPCPGGGGRGANFITLARCHFVEIDDREEDDDELSDDDGEVAQLASDLNMTLESYRGWRASYRKSAPEDRVSE